jgi:hypothetical protein
LNGNHLEILDDNAKIDESTYKIARLIEKYGLGEEYGDRLEASGQKKAVSVRVSGH